jgi:hypothetical protein
MELTAASTKVLMWSRLDRPGQDFCRILRTADGYQFEGVALFDDGGPCALQYEVDTSALWITRRARLHGHVARKPVDLRIRKGRGGWFLNGQRQSHIVDCIDLDLGITPATNQIAIRRLSLRVGQQAEAPAAYLAFPSLRLSVLAQTYRRTARREYQYEAPAFGYSGVIKVDRNGAVEHYSGLFRRIGGSGR